MLQDVDLEIDINCPDHVCIYVMVCVVCLLYNMHGTCTTITEVLSSKVWRAFQYIVETQTSIVIVT